MAEQNKCPVCSENAPLADHYQGGSYKLNCVRCGLFEIGDISAHEISCWNSQQRINLSGWIRDNQNCKIFSPTLKVLAALPNLTVGEKAEKILMQLARKFPKPGEITDLSGGAHLEFLGVGRLADTSELQFFIRDYLYAEMGFLLRHELVTQLGDDSRYSISPKGWAYLDSLRHGNPNSQIGFIGMWFDKSVDATHSAIEIAIRTAGYEPLRIDRAEHNNKIDDEIVAGIRRSKFLVADFTGHRGGVYFEAGLAIGLGLPVIWLCRQDELEKTHFDARQYNFIVWKAEDLFDLSAALQNRIEATIGRGPLIGKS
jgi:nucleoside 2-deoxyribosyltransferase/ribosomal protein S27AE